MPFQNLWVIFLLACANFICSSCLCALLRVGRASPQVLAYWQSMQSRRVIEAIKWLGFPMYWRLGTCRILWDEIYFSNICAAVTSLIPPSRVLIFRAQ
jgi:hypothetical protein